MLKILDKIKPPKLNITQPEAYLNFPEDDSEFPIEVSSDEVALQESTESSEESDSEEDEEDEDS